jgi:hypothetical protein
VIVHDAGDAWQVVMQPHHGDLAGQLAEAWGNERFARPDRRDSLAIAATRHDDGWAVWERWPQAMPDGKPMPFIEVHIRSHLAFYTAAIADVTDQDPYAGLLVAMHGAGLYRERYGTQPGLRNRWADSHRVEIEAFVESVEGTYGERVAEAGVSEEERWAAYKLLQVYDRLSLYFSGLFPVRMREPHVIAPVPVDEAGGETELRVQPVSAFEPYSPSHVRIDPFPFADSPARFTLERRVLPKKKWGGPEFREALLSAPTETVSIVAEAA